MKVKSYLIMAVASLLMSNCSKEETPSQLQVGSNTLTATIEGSSRSAVTDGGVFSWTSGDEISVYNGADFTTYTYSGSGNAFSTNETITPTGVAIYPADDEHLYDNGEVKVNMKESYAYGSTNAPMLADVQGATLAFKHLGGVMRFVVKNVPSTATAFTFTANSRINGAFDVTDGTDGNRIIATDDETEGNTTTISFGVSDIKDVMTFYIPLPTGTYSGYTVSIGGKSHTTEETVENTIKRGSLLLMPTFTYVENETNLQKSTDNIVVMNGNEELNLDVTHGEEVTVNMANGATATLNLTVPTGTTDGTVSISDGSAEGTESTTSAGTLNVAAENVANLNINVPTLTVNLTSGTFGTVEALTAEQTLIIGEGVSIEKLILKGGNVKLEGDLELTYPLEVNQDLILDLNGYTLSTAEENGDNWSAAVIVYSGNVTIKGGTIATNGTEAHKLMGAVWVRGTESANVTIENGTFKGNNWNENATNQLDCMATVYVSNPLGCVTINGGDFHCVQQEQVEGQNQILNYKNDFTTQNIVVKGGTFHGMNPAKGNGVEISYLADDAVVAETSAGVFEVLPVVDGAVTLNKDLTVVSPLEIRNDLTLNLNNYTLSTAEENGDNWSAAVIVYSGNVTIKGGTIATNGTEAHKLMGAVWVRGTESANVTIENGTFKGNNWNENATNQLDCMATVYVSNPLGYVTINGGNFHCVQQDQVEGQNQLLNYKNDFSTQNIVVKGGTFHGMNPAKGNGVEVSYLAEGYQCTESQEGDVKVYTVSVEE